MKKMEYLEELTGRHPVLKAVKEDIRAAYKLLKGCYEQGGEVFIAGNGGSCADSEHIAGELVKNFAKRHPVPPEFAHMLRQADPQRGAALAEEPQGVLPAIVLTGHTTLSTTFLNDVDEEMIYTQQLCGCGKRGDIFVGISTSGSTKNVMYAAAVTEAMEIKVIGLAEKDGGALTKAGDVPIMIPEKKTFKIQELHLPVYHALCLILEEYFYEV